MSAESSADSVCCSKKDIPLDLTAGQAPAVSKNGGVRPRRTGQRWSFQEGGLVVGTKLR